MRSSLRTLSTTAVVTGSLLLGAAAAVAHETYEVQPGDTLAEIAEELDEVSTWRELLEANRDVISDPNLIFPGQVLTTTVTATSAPSAPAASSAEPAPEPAPAPAPATSDAGVWDRLAQCESGGDWSINTGNGYYGGLQFTLSSWEAVGGTGFPHEASREEQISRGQALQAIQGWGAWPSCASQLGLR